MRVFQVTLKYSCGQCSVNRAAQEIKAQVIMRTKYICWDTGGEVAAEFFVVRTATQRY
jgi:hypothetical protein